MNQILSINNEQNKKKRNNIKNEEKVKREPSLNSIKRANTASNKADLSKVVRIFCILIILFGIVLIGQSTYALISNREKQKDEVTVSEEQMGKETKITVETNYPIESFSFRWNDGEWSTVPGDGTVLFETIIQIPNGNNILNMTVTDYYGTEHKLHNKQYIYESSDITKPVIDVRPNGPKISITATDDIEMAYITYSWNGEEATRVDANKNDKLKIQVDADVPEGQNKLTVVAADKEGNRETTTESIVGDIKPTFTASLDGQNLIISASDDQGLSKISVTVDDQTIEQTLNQKEVTASLPLTPGNHVITISVTNINNLTATESYRI